MDDYRIWVTYHKDEQVQQYDLHDDDTHRLFASHRDVEGVNINTLNPVYSEMVTMYWVWKNSVKTKYVGFNHYRRRFSVSRLPDKGECQVYRMIDFGSKTVYQQYAQCHNVADMDTVLSILRNRYGEGNAYSRYITEGHVLIANCCFLMKWQDFTKLCKFLFTILDDFASMCGCQTLEDWRKKAQADFGSNRTEYQTRVVSFLAERLISAWIMEHLSPYIGGRNVAIVNFNTTKLTEAAISSLFKKTPGCHVYVFDNSDKDPFKTKLPNVEVIDNTKGQVIDFAKELRKYKNKWTNEASRNDYGSAKHAMSIDRLTEMIPDGFVLMDSDVLVKENISAFWNRDFACAGVEELKQGVPLIMPILCWLNVPMLKKNGIRYFNGEKMWALTNKEPDGHYDTGAWLLEAVRKAGLPIEYVNVWRYVVHLKGGSWMKKDADRWLEENEGLWKE